ncbi:MAG TPA: hypothetical protein VH396_15395 [Chitinophagaceae bacterium]|jgi:hypothetical protein
MQANDFELEDVISNIAGIWHNPFTKDAYRFSAEKNDIGFGEVFILQHALRAPLRFNYQIIKDEEGLWLKIDENRMRILKLTSYPQPVFTFKSANNNIVSLFKDYLATMEEL